VFNEQLLLFFQIHSLYVV